MPLSPKLTLNGWNLRHPAAAAGAPADGAHDIDTVRPTLASAIRLWVSANRE